MHVELIGSTGSGKTTLATNIVRLYQAKGVDAVFGDDFVLEQFKLAWVRPPLLRTLLVDACSIVGCLTTLRANFRYYRFAIRQVGRLPAEVGRFERINLLRNVFKKAGIYELIKRRGAGRSLILVDEGTLQSAHNLFVHVSYPPHRDEIAAFAKVVQLPNVALLVSQPEPVLVERTTLRGHKRIPKGSPENVALFIQRAIDTFKNLADDLVANGRLIGTDDGSGLMARPDYRDDASIRQFLAIACNRQTAVESKSTGSERSNPALLPSPIGLTGRGHG